MPALLYLLHLLHLPGSLCLLPYPSYPGPRPRHIQPYHRHFPLWLLPHRPRSHFQAWYLFPKAPHLVTFRHPRQVHELTPRRVPLPYLHICPHPPAPPADFAEQTILPAHSLPAWQTPACCHFSTGCCRRPACTLAPMPHGKPSPEMRQQQSSHLQNRKNKTHPPAQDYSENKKQIHLSQGKDCPETCRNNPPGYTAFPSCCNDKIPAMPYPI